jgi:hypothetical protein
VGGISQENHSAPVPGAEDDFVQIVLDQFFRLDKLVKEMGYRAAELGEMLLQPLDPSLCGIGFAGPGVDHRKTVDALPIERD